MTNTATALYRFFSGFGIPAFVEYNVPDKMPDGTPVKPPYITYQVVNPDWPDTAPLYARVWYRGTNYAAINATVDAIEAAVKGGISIPTEGGCVVLNKGTPFAQEQPMEGDDTLKVYYLLFEIMAPTD